MFLMQQLHASGNATMIASLLLSIVCGSSFVMGRVAPLHDIEIVQSDNLAFRIGSPDGQNDCNLVCPTTVDYHCGTDGITYINPCLLLNANCLNHDIKLAYKGICSATKPLPATSCPEKWSCIGHYVPMCGSDEKTYDNNCYLVIANCRDTSIGFKHYGACGTPIDNCKNTCIGHKMRPVCGTDNVIYRNQCELKNAACENALIEEKPCPGQLQPKKCSGVCLLNYEPKCGTDGKSYINKCHLDLNTCRNPKITLEYDGACVPTTEPATSCTECSGNEPEDYICGSDGVSYRSACAFNNALCKLTCPATLRLEHSGKCNCYENCAFDKYDAVCGSDSKTYDSVCKFRVASCTNPLIKLSSTGECRKY